MTQLDFTSKLEIILHETALVQQALLREPGVALTEIADVMRRAIAGDHKMLLCGCGGSAADAQHVAAEFVSRFTRERRALPAIALTTDTSIITAISNDYDFARVFARQVEALARPGDVVVGISTSGQSKAVLAAMQTAQAIGAVTVGFTGADGGQLKSLVQHCFCAPSNVTARIQEAHLVAWHALCEYIEETLQ